LIVFVTGLNHYSIAIAVSDEKILILSLHNEYLERKSHESYWN